MIAPCSVVTLARRIADGELRAEDVCQDAFARIDRLEPELSAFLALARGEALEAACVVDARRARGEPLGPLAGVPIAVKDALCTRGTVTTAGSRILEKWVPPYDATVVSRLREAGAILVGKTTMDEFAMGSSTENSAHGPTRNPWDLSRTPGGSSGGSAAAVAARQVPGALGSDTGGSIRQPAAFTGVVGIKPSYGRVSRFGLVAFASSLDQVGPLATDVRSAARLLSVIGGHDRRDATSAREPLPDLEGECGQPVLGLRLGVPEEYFGEGLDPEVRAAVDSAIASLEAQGCRVVPVSLPHTRHAVASYYVLATAEASSNLSRFDGVRYGLRVQASSLRAMIGETRDAGFGVEVKRRILLGTFVLSAGYYEAYYRKAQKVRSLIRRDFDEAFRSVDAIVSPTTPTAAFALGEKISDPLAMYLSDVYTLPASLAGLPAVSVPCGLTRSGLPIGLQIVTRPWAEATALRLASAWEEASPVRDARPGLAS